MGADARFELSVDNARSCFTRSVDRFCSLVAHAPDGGLAVPGSAWSIAELVAHVTLATEAYAQYAAGDDDSFADVSDIAGGSLTRSNAARLADERERDLPSLVTRVRAAASRVVAATEARDPNETVHWNRQPVSLAALLGLAAGEHVLHGFDLARALGERYVIAPEDARVVIAAALPMLPLLVKPDTTARVDASYDLAVRGGPRVTVRIANGTMRVDPPGGAVDCHVSADPVALLLVSYGRRGQWGPALSGQLLAWGRKPWLGLRFTSYLVAP